MLRMPHARACCTMRSDKAYGRLAKRKQCGVSFALAAWILSHLYPWGDPILAATTAFLHAGGEWDVTQGSEQHNLEMWSHTVRSPPPPSGGESRNLRMRYCRVECIINHHHVKVVLMLCRCLKCARQ